jgi:RHS repeat-associated protein
MANGTSSWTYGYNYANELTSAKLGGTTVATYGYDANGQLVKSVETRTQVFAYQGSDQIYAENTATSSVVEYFYADGLLVASVNGSSTSYFHEDALGSVRLESGASLTTLYASDYTPYGGLSGASGVVSFAYTGKMKDPATALYYSGARWYNAGIWRFITEDSYPTQLSNPLSQNRYIYAEDNPMTLTDPTGHYSVKSVAGGGSLPPGFVTWAFEYHWASIVNWFVAAITAVLDPFIGYALSAVFSTIGWAAGFHALGNDLNSILSAVQNGNSAGIAAAVFTAIVDFANLAYNSANIIEKLDILLGVGEEAGVSVVTGGTFDIAQYTIGLVFAVLSGIALYATLLAAYNENHSP